jgi:FtsH-binding integral membrane protein
VFLGLAAWDVQKLKNLGMQISGDGEAVARASILGALALYLDFINLFLLLLRILGGRRN